MTGLCQPVVATIILGGIEIPFHAGLNLTQSYDALGGFAVLRTMNGSAIKQQNWSKLQTQISGDGTIPNGLASLDFSVSHILACGASRSVASLSEVITLPPGRRAEPDFVEKGYAITGIAFEGALWVETPITGIVSDVATLTIVPGALQYRVDFFPLLTVFAEPPSDNMNVHGSDFNWSISAEEV